MDIGPRTREWLRCAPTRIAIVCLSVALVSPCLGEEPKALSQEPLWVRDLATKQPSRDLVLVTRITRRSTDRPRCSRTQSAAKKRGEPKLAQSSLTQSWSEDWLIQWPPWPFTCNHRKPVLVPNA